MTHANLEPTMDTQPKCERCGEPVSGICAFDPRPQPFGESFRQRVMHPNCATLTEIEEGDRRAAAKARLELAAPAMLHALRIAERAMAGKTDAASIHAVRAAIAAAEDRTCGR